MTDLTLPADGLRGRLLRLVEARPTQRFITALILINAVTLGLETSRTAMDAAGPVLVAVDRAILAVFVLELTAKLVACRLTFFRSGWNVFDFVIVGISLIPSSGAFSVLRALRILRVLRLLSVVPQMRSVVEALLRAIPGMGSVVAVLALIFYVGAVLATKLFGSYPDPDMQEWFGTIGASMYTLFQVMTLESWSMGIVRPTMELFPWSWGFFVPFIVITAFAVLNLFIAIIVNAMQSAHQSEVEAEIEDRIEDRMRQREDAAAPDSAALVAEMVALRREVAALRSLMERR